MDRTPHPEQGIPPELLVPPPRAVRRVRNRVAIFFLQLVFIPEMLAGFGFVLFFAVEPIFIRFSTPVPGVVRKLKVVHSSKGGVSYHVLFDYFPAGKPNGDPARGEDLVTKEELESLHRGQSVNVHTAGIDKWRYSTLDRSRAFYVRNRRAGWVVSVFVGSLAALIFYVAWELPARVRRLVRKGQPTIGRIIGKTTARGKYQMYIVTYQFATNEHRHTQQTAKATVSREDYYAAREGGKVIVLYNPKRPKMSLLYDYSDVKVVT